MATVPAVRGRNPREELLLGDGGRDETCIPRQLRVGLVEPGTDDVRDGVVRQRTGDRGGAFLGLQLDGIRIGAAASPQEPGAL